MIGKSTQCFLLIGSMMLLCGTGDINFDYLVKLVSARIQYKVTNFLSNSLFIRKKIIKSLGSLGNKSYYFI